MRKGKEARKEGGGGKGGLDREIRKGKRMGSKKRVEEKGVLFTLLLRCSGKGRGGGVRATN